MKNFLYFFVNRDKTEFKIGITEDIEERYLRLTSLWGEIDLAASCMLAGSRREVAGLERTLHFLLENWRMEKPCRLEGRREWFSMACFEKAFEILQSAAGLRGFDLQDKLSRGIPIAMRETRDRVVRERPAVETIANFDGIKQLWPAILGAFETYQQCHDFMASHLLPWLSGGGEAVQDHGFSPSTPLDNQDSYNMSWETFMSRLNGEYTERDRKLYAFLVHAVWDELETTRIHALSVAEINKVFRALGGDFSPQWIWESARRLNKTSIEWVERSDSRLSKGIASLLSYARTDSEAQESGYLYFEIPAGLAQIIKAPGRFARLRIHFMLGLSGKYAVTLYEILESAANLKNPALEVELATSLLYPHCHYSYRQVRSHVAALSSVRRDAIVALGVKHRGRHDELLRDCAEYQALFREQYFAKEGV